MSRLAQPCGLQMLARTLRSLALAGILAGAAPLHAQQAPQPAPPGKVIGVGNFAHVVADLDHSLGFYRDVLGLEVTGLQPFVGNAAVGKFGNTEGAQSRIAVLEVPGSALGVELIEYKDIEREPQNPRFHDPGAGNLALRVRDLDALFPKIEQYPGVNVLTAGGEPVTVETPNGVLHALFVQDPDGFVVELIEDADGPAVRGGTFEATAADSEESVRFYNDLLGFNMTLGTEFNSNQQMASTAGVPGASFKQSTSRIPGTNVNMILIEFKDIERKRLSGRTQDPGTTVLQLRVRDVTALTAELAAAGVPIVSAGGEPVEVVPGVKVAIVRDPNNMLLELVETTRQ